MCRFHDGKTEASVVACCQPGAYGLCPHVDSSVTWMGSCRSSRAPEVAGVPRALCSPDTDCPLAPSFQKCEVRRASGDRKSPGLGMGGHLCLQLQTLGWPGKQGSFQQGGPSSGETGAGSVSVVPGSFFIPLWPSLSERPTGWGVTSSWYERWCPFLLKREPRPRLSCYGRIMRKATVWRETVAVGGLVSLYRA